MNRGVSVIPQEQQLGGHKCTSISQETILIDGQEVSIGSYITLFSSVVRAKWPCGARVFVPIFLRFLEEQRFGDGEAIEILEGHPLVGLS